MRPFKVAARDQTVVATGTAFNIDVSAPIVCVTLIEGRAVVLDRDAIKAKPVELRGGQQLVAPANAPAVVEVANLAEATAWQQGKIIFDDKPAALNASAMDEIYAGLPSDEQGATENLRPLRVAGS